MFSGSHVNKKRARGNQCSTTSKARKCQTSHRMQPRLPDYLLNHPHADAIQNLFAAARDKDCLNEVLDITSECHTRKFDMEYLHDWLAIFLFLRDPEQVTPHLDELENSLQQKARSLAKRRKFNLTEDEKFALPDAKRNPYDHLKILSGVLYEWAKENGFRQRAKFNALIKSSDFMRLLRQKTIFKDSSVSADIHHGSWPHPIQWYCIIEHHKITPFLLHDPLDVLKSFGDDKQLATARSSKLAWDMIVDRFDRNMFFTSPYVITSYLAEENQMQKWPLLGGSIQRQEEKSQYKFGDYRGYTTYLAEKHDHQNFIIKKL